MLIHLVRSGIEKKMMLLDELDLEKGTHTFPISWIFLFERSCLKLEQNSVGLNAVYLGFILWDL